MTQDITTLENMIRESQEDCDRLVEDIASIKEQIARAATTARQTRNYSDSDWYHSANRALRHKQAAHQKALRYTAELRRQLKSVKQIAHEPIERTFERQFMIEAKALLPDTTYHEIISRTQRTAGGST